MDYNYFKKSDDQHFLDIEEILTPENIHIQHLSVLNSANKRAIYQLICLLKFIIHSKDLFNDLYKEFEAINNRTSNLKLRLNSISQQVKYIDSKYFVIPNISELFHQRLINIRKIDFSNQETIRYNAINQSTNFLNKYFSARNNKNNDIKKLLKYKSDIKNGLICKPADILRLQYVPDNSVDMDFMVQCNDFQQRSSNTSVQDNIQTCDSLSISHFSHDTLMHLSNDHVMVEMPLKQICLDTPPLPSIRQLPKDMLTSVILKNNDAGNSDDSEAKTFRNQFVPSKSRSLSAEPVNWSERNSSQAPASDTMPPLESIHILRSSQASMQVAIDTSGLSFDRYQLVRRYRQMSLSHPDSFTLDQANWEEPTNSSSCMIKSHDAVMLAHNKYYSCHVFDDRTTSTELIKPLEGMCATTSRDSVEHHNKPMTRSVSMPCKSHRSGLMLGCVSAGNKEKSVVAPTSLQRSNSFVQRARNFFKIPPSTRGVDEQLQLMQPTKAFRQRQRSPSPMGKNGSSQVNTRGPLLRKSRGREKSVARLSALGAGVSKLAEQIRNRSRSSSASAAATAAKSGPVHSIVSERSGSKHRSACNVEQYEEIRKSASCSNYLTNIEAMKWLQVERERMPWRVNTFAGVSMHDLNVCMHQQHHEKGPPPHRHFDDSYEKEHYFDKEMLRPMSYPQNLCFGNLTLHTAKKPPKGRASAVNKSRCSVPCKDLDAHGHGGQVNTTFCVNQNTAEQLRRLSQQFNQAVSFRRSHWSSTNQERHASSSSMNDCNPLLQYPNANMSDIAQCSSQLQQHGPTCPRLQHFQHGISPLQDQACSSSVRHSVSTDSAVELNLTPSDRNRSDGTDCSLTSSAGNGSYSYIQPQLFGTINMVSSSIGIDSSLSNVDKNSDELLKQSSTSTCTSSATQKRTLKNNLKHHAPVPPPRITSLTKQQLLNNASDQLSSSQEPIYAQIKKQNCKPASENSSQPKLTNVSSTATIQLQSSNSFNDFKSFYNKFPYRSGTLSKNLSCLLRKRNSVPYDDDDENNTNMKQMPSVQPPFLATPNSILSAEQINAHKAEKRDLYQSCAASSSLVSSLSVQVQKPSNFASKASVNLSDFSTSTKVAQQHRVLVPFALKATDTRTLHADGFGSLFTPFMQLQTVDNVNVKQFDSLSQTQHAKSSTNSSTQPLEDCPFTRLSEKSLLVKTSCMNSRVGGLNQS